MEDNVQDHMILVTLERRLEQLDYLITLKAHLPLFVVRDLWLEMNLYCEEKTISCSSGRLDRCMKKELRKAQKRYRKIKKFQSLDMAYVKRVNITHPID